MTSYFLLSNCGVLFVLFGSVVCPLGRNTDGASSSSACEIELESFKTIRDGIIPEVRLIRHFASEAQIKGGLVRSKRRTDGLLAWEFYEPPHWNPDNGGGLNEGAKMANILIVGGKTFQVTRDSKEVYFWYKRGHELIKDYTVIFTSEDDAMVFTGEAIGQ